MVLEGLQNFAFSLFVVKPCKDRFSESIVIFQMRGTDKQSEPR